MLKKIIKWIGIILLIIVLIIGVFIYNSFSQFDKFKQGKLEEGFKHDTIPFTYHNTGHILIDVKINDSDKTYPFILDNGANNYVFKNFTKEHSLEGNGFAFSIGAVGNMFFTRIRKIQSVQIGKAKFTNLNAEESNLNWDCMDEVYGLIGPSIMKHLIWEIDFQKKIIVMSKHLDHAKINGDVIKIPVISSGLNYLDVNLKFRHNKIYKKVRIDLGNSGTLSLAENLLTEDGLRFKKKRILGTGSIGLGYDSNNMSLDESYYLVDSLIFQNSNYSVSKIPVDASPSSYNFLGLGFFEKYNVIISWKDKIVILSPIDSTQNFVWKTYGFSTGYNENKNRVEIESITENTPASKVELPLFSEVISINQKTFTSSESYCEYKASRSMEDTVNIEIRHNDSIKRFKLTKELLFSLDDIEKTRMTN